MAAVNSLTSLYWAAAQGHHQIVGPLLIQSSELSFTANGEGWNVLHVACREGHSKVVAQLLQYSPKFIDTVTTSGYTALHIAADRGHLKLVLQLVTYSPKLMDAADERGMTALHVALREATMAHEQIAHALLSRKPALVRAVDETGNTMLHMAVIGGNPRLIDAVWRLDKGALRTVNKQQKTPFQLAIIWSCKFAFELFQAELCFDEVVAALTECMRAWRVRPLVDQHCGRVLLRNLSLDILGVVYEFLGLQAPACVA